MAVEKLPRPWLLAAITGLPVAGLARCAGEHVQEVSDDGQEILDPGGEDLPWQVDRRRRRLRARGPAERWYAIDEWPCH